MSTPILNPTATPLTRPVAMSSSVAPLPDRPGKSELDVAVEGFEKLMVQRLLSAARRTQLGEEPTNARTNHEAMFDEAIAGVIAERGDLGLADALRQSLDTTGSLRLAQQPSTSPIAIESPRGPMGLDTSALAALRDMLDGGPSTDASLDGAMAMPARTVREDATPDAERGLSGEATMRALAKLGASERLESALATGDAALARRAFVDGLRPHAERGAERLGTSADAVLAIAAHESGWGRFPITASDGRDSHNLFGIKSHGRDGPAVQRTTTEFIGGVARRTVAEFRAYSDPGASVDDFANFLIENPRYADALRVAADPDRFFDALQAAGYATDPDYADKARAVLRQVREVSEEPAT